MRIPRQIHGILLLAVRFPGQASAHVNQPFIMRYIFPVYNKKRTSQRFYRIIKNIMPLHRILPVYPDITCQSVIPICFPKQSPGTVYINRTSQLPKFTFCNFSLSSRYSFSIFSFTHCVSLFSASIFYFSFAPLFYLFLLQKGRPYLPFDLCFEHPSYLNYR